MKDEKLLIKSVFRDTYNLIIKYLDMESNESSWVAFSREVGVLSNKYDSKLCNDILRDALEYMETKICITKVMKDEKLLIKSVFRDTYNLIIKYLDIESNESNWVAFSREVGVLSNKYDNKLCNDILRDALEYMETKICITKVIL